MKNIFITLFAWIIELALLAAYLIIGFDGIVDGITSLDFEAIFEAVDDAILFFTIATLIVALMFLIIKPLRTKTTRSMAIANLIWAISNIVYMITNY